eukprot:CAMPEP_0178931236 /NCGR_PEP_ID=MMETSP0786-20121207/21793_1 /TAXON_ID=186022 /ORGANISM="Thalassionema frauenfeldii, Strain CCMP 1798" /LENGTH=570 /DNA_ID=CAMNT_0020608081 /DNA_START=130 /DNA_END=1839 /DNA_ORIENTATION=+
MYSNTTTSPMSKLSPKSLLSVKPSPTSVTIEIPANDSNDSADLENLSSSTSSEEGEVTQDHAMASLNLLPLSGTTTRQLQSSTLSIGVAQSIQPRSIERFRESIMEEMRITAFDVDENNVTKQLPIRSLQSEEKIRLEKNKDNDQQRIEGQEDSIVVVVTDDDVKATPSQSLANFSNSLENNNAVVDSCGISQQLKQESSTIVHRSPAWNDHKDPLFPQAIYKSSSSSFDSSDDDDDVLLVGSLTHVMKDEKTPSLSSPKQIPVQQLVQYQWYLLITILAYAQQKPRDNGESVSVSNLERMLANVNTEETSHLVDSKLYPKNITKIWSSLKIQGQNASMVSQDDIIDTIQYDTVHQNYLYAICVSKVLDMVTVVLNAREPRSPTDSLPEYYQYTACEYGENSTTIGIDRGWSKIIGEKGQLLDEILVQAQRHSRSRLLLVGHGGGGVLATLCGVWACRRRRRTRQNQSIQIMSFGLRPVGDANFKKIHGLLEYQGQLQHLRFSNQSDCRSMATEFFTSNSNNQEEVEEEQKQKDLLPRRGAFGALVSLQDVNVKEKAHSIEAYDETVRDW